MPDATSSFTQKEENNLYNNNLESANNDDSNTSNCDDSEMAHSLRSSSATIEASNRRGRSRQRSKRGKGDRRELRTKFQIESLYIEISELKKQNEELKKIWGDVQVQQTSQTQESLSNLRQQQHQVPSTVDVMDSSDTGRLFSDLEINISDRECESDRKNERGGGGGGGFVDRKFDYTISETEEDIMQMGIQEHEMLFS